MKKTLLLAAALVLLAVPALAQDVTPVIDSAAAVADDDWITPLRSAFITALVPVLGTLATIALARLNKWLSGKVDGEARDAILDGAQNAGRKIVGQLVAAASGGKITRADLLQLVAEAVGPLLDTYRESADTLQMSKQDVASRIQGAAEKAFGERGLAVDLDAAGVVATAPLVAAALPAVVNVTLPEGRSP